MNPGAELADYFQGPHRKPDRPGALGRLSMFIPSQAVSLLRSAATTAITPMSRRRAKVGPGLRLHLGCGFNHLAGWTNIDRLGAKADVFWDLRRGIPYPDDSVDAVFHEHLLEHLHYRTGFKFSMECLRVLKPGGTLRVAVPSASRIMNLYVNQDDELAKDSPTRMMGAAQALAGYGHVAMYDAETLTGLLLAAGFAEARECEFGESAIAPCPDGDGRRFESLYVEAIKTR